MSYFVDLYLKLVKEIFRSLAKILHPDVNKNLDEEMMELWLKVKEAYENNELMTLIILEGIVKHNEFKEDIKVTSIEENISILKKEINELKNFIDKEENSFPLNIKELIDDNEYIKDKKQDITDDIHEYERMIMGVEKSISEILEEKSYG
jgi:peptidoglycan hydrolase CwlO-like protein